MPTPEQQLEEALIEKLRTLKYEYRPDIRDRATLEKNFREKFEALTGSGKTLTSLNASTLLKDNPDIEKCLFVVDRTSARPGQLFYSMQIPVCLGFLAKNKSAAAKRGFRDRRLLTDPAHSVS